jgi:hypothetical protein
MINIDQYILLFLKEKKEEIEKFKDYIKTSKLPKKIISPNEWKAIYLNWATQQEEGIEKTGKMPKIYLNND